MLKFGKNHAGLSIQKNAGITPCNDLNFLPTFENNQAGLAPFVHLFFAQNLRKIMLDLAPCDI